MLNHAGQTGSFEAPAGALAWSILDHRREPRFVCQGELKIVSEPSPGDELTAEMVDISNNGFRAAYAGELLAVETQFTFRHFFFKGRARVMWSRAYPDHNESGCLVLRD